jgi:hypothetical protein
VCPCLGSEREFWFIAISFVPEALGLIFRAEQSAADLPLTFRQFTVATITHGEVKGWKCWQKGGIPSINKHPNKSRRQLLHE